MQDIRLKTIMTYYGEKHQRLKLIEEIGEMLAEVGRYIADGEQRTTKDDIVSELADVVIVIRQLYPDASKVERKVPEGEDVARQLCEKAALLAAMVVGGPFTKLEISYAESTIALIDRFVRQLAEVPKLQMAIEQKIERQIGRILRSEGADGNRR